MGNQRANLEMAGTGGTGQGPQERPGPQGNTRTSTPRLLYFTVLCKCRIFYQLTRLITQFRIVMLEKTLQSPLASKEIEPVNPKGNQP